MRLTAFLLLVTALHVSASGNSQNVSCVREKITLKQALGIIEKQTGYSFLADKSIMENAPPVNLNLKNASVKEALDQCLRGISYTYEIHGKIILIKPGSPAAPKIEMPDIPPVDQEIKGRVTDSLGIPLRGVSVVIKGSNKGTVTDAKGAFSLRAEDKDILVISLVGYAPREIMVNGRTDISIILKLSNVSLDQFVVVGYGVQKKLDLTGSVSTVNTHDITNRPVTSLTNSLQGSVPGMTILGRPGDVGGDIGTVNIRGRGNLASSSPLYVVDGIPVSADDFARIDPLDVESISVLKDAASSAIYGSRAAYGVILVTTKKGRKDGPMQVSYNSYYGSQKALILPHYLGSNQYARLRNEAAENAGKADIFSAVQLAAIQAGNSPDLYPNNDWYKLTLRNTAPLWANELNISGGGKTRYYISGSVMNQASLIPGKDLTRYSFRSNTESQVSKIFKAGTSVSFIRDEYRMTKGDISFTTLNRELPTVVNKQSDGNWGTINAGAIDATHASGNPIRYLKEGGHSDSAVNRFLGSLTGSLTPLKGLSIDGMLSYNFANSNASLFKNQMDPLINFNTKQPISGTGQANSLTSRWINNYSLLAQAYATYEHRINDHFGKLMAGTSYENNQSKRIQAYRDGFPSNNLNVIDAGAQNADLNNGGNSNERVFLSYFGRFNYSFRDKYLLEANLRADASSQFAPGHRWGYFPSFSAGWKLSDETFMQSVRWVTNLKVRGSWGKLGNVNNVGYYDYFDVLATGQAAILGNNFVNGVWPSSVPNPSLTWEVVNMTNIGIDGSLLKDHLSVQLDAYNKVTENILLKLPQPQELGIPAAVLPATNAAKVQNKGIEVALAYTGDIGKLHYTVAGNLSKVWNKILDLHGQDNQISTYYINKQGQAIGSFYMLQADGLFRDSAAVTSSAAQGTNTHPGDIKYKDLNGPNGKPDGVIDGNDRTIAGNDVPYFSYGANLSLSYHNFDLFVIGQGVTNVSVYLEDEASQAFFNAAGVKEFHLDRWTRANPNPGAAYPRMLISADNFQNLQQSSFWLFNAAYFRVKTLAVGYTLPGTFCSRLHIQKLRFYASSNNPFTIRGDKRLKDFDPESPSTRSTYPQLKTWSLGLNLTF